ncbi:MAG: helix-turn-helix domain-containing protein, partial [Thermoanaerobaculia bacterium]
MARLLRALSGKTQEQFGKETGIQTALLAQFELGKAIPARPHLERMAAAVKLSVSSTEDALRYLDTLRRPRNRRGAGAKPILGGIAEGVRSELDHAYRRLLGVRLPDLGPQEEDRWRAAELFNRLEGLSQAARMAVVEVAEECQSWALCERACDASEREASRNLEQAAAWAQIARRISERVRGSEEWRNRLQGYAVAHVANVLRVSGDLGSADITLGKA